MDIITYLNSLIKTAETSTDANIQAFGQTLQSLLAEVPTVLPILVADGVDAAIAAAAKSVPILALAETLEPGVLNPFVEGLATSVTATLGKALTPATPTQTTTAPVAPSEPIADESGASSGAGIVGATVTAVEGEVKNLLSHL